MATPKAIERAFGISVEGRGATEVEPDFAELRISVVREDASAQAAYRSALEAGDAITKALSEAGVSGRDIRADPILLEPKQDDGKERTHRARRAYRLWYDRPAELDALTGRLVEAGVDAVEWVRFGSRELSAALASARVQAIDDARHKARAHAEAVGAELGRVLAVEDRKNDPGREFAIEPPVSDGALIVRATVMVGFSLERRGTTSGFG